MLQANHESDASIIRRVLEGDSRAFETLMARYQDTVARFVWKVISSPEDREEVCQDVFVKVYFKLDQFRADSKFSTWLYQVAYRTAISHGRRKKLDLVEYTDEDFPIAQGSELDQDTVARLLDTQLARLKLEDRTVLTLHYMQDMSMDEISVIVDKPAGTVKSILHRVRKKLNDTLSPELLEAIA